jgi:hypothetical protein
VAALDVPALAGDGTQDLSAIVRHPGYLPIMDWRETRFRLTLFFFEKVWAAVYLGAWALVALGAIVWLVMAIL